MTDTDHDRDDHRHHHHDSWDEPATRGDVAELRQEVRALYRNTHRSLWHLQQEIANLRGRQATAITLTIGGTMPGQITVDTTNETATIAFIDDKGNSAAEPAGADISFSSSDETVATVAVDADNPLQADITPVGIGTCEISASSGGTALEADGTTPIPDPSPVSVTVAAGAAAGESFVLSA